MLRWFVIAFVTVMITSVVGFTNYSESAAHIGKIIFFVSVAFLLWIMIPGPTVSRKKASLKQKSEA